MKKLLFASAILVAGLGFTSCSSDDDVAHFENELVGTWKAEMLKYDAGVHSGEYPFDHEVFKQGCATDYLTLNADHVASLKENNKLDEACVDVITEGNWNNEKITINGVDRTVDFVNETELILTYPLTFMGQTLDVEVSYSRQ